MTTVWLIRHGESMANARSITPNPTDTALTDLGHEQACKVSRAFSEAPELMVTSPFIRTKQTAAPLLDRFPRISQVEWPIQEYTFLSPARYANTDRATRRPDALNYKLSADPHYVDGEGAESFIAFIERVQTFYHLVQNLPERFVAVFSHGLFIKAVIWYTLTTPCQIDSEIMRSFFAFTTAFEAPSGSILPLKIEGGCFYFGGFRIDHL